MESNVPRKRHRSQQGYNRKHDRHKFRKATNPSIHRKDLGNGLKGFLFSCTPHHERQAFQDAVILLSRFCESDTPIPTTPPKAKAQSMPGENTQDPPGTVSNRSNSTPESSTPVLESTATTSKHIATTPVLTLQDELAALRAPEERLFTRVDPAVQGAVFLRLTRPSINLEAVAEAVLRDARATGSPGSRHCMRMLPIHSTCYAKEADAAKAAVEVVASQFPFVSESSPVSYAISFRARLNSGAKRDSFIPEIAAAISKAHPLYSVNLGKPDVVLIVEILKTSCCIGSFRHFYELSKMNLREAACPTVPKSNTANKTEEGSTKPAVGEAKNITYHVESNAEPTVSLPDPKIQVNGGKKVNVSTEHSSCPESLPDDKIKPAVEEKVEEISSTGDQNSSLDQSQNEVLENVKEVSGPLACNLSSGQGMGSMEGKVKIAQNDEHVNDNNIVNTIDREEERH